jgi:transcriptional regulator with GAF, ATPase, and Fis domain
VRIASLKRQRFAWFVLLLVVGGLGFFLPISLGAWIGLIVKIVLFLVMVYVLHSLFSTWDGQDITGSETEYSGKPPVIQDREETQKESGAWKGFGWAFQDYSGEFLTVVRNAVVASCSGFYLRKGDDTLEFQMGETEGRRVTARTLVPEGDLVEQVMRNESSILEGNLPIGMTLAGIPGMEIRSFLGVPISWKGEVVGTLAVGSGATESFGEEDRDFLVHCGGLISRVMALCHRGIRWEMDQEVFQIHRDMEKAILSATDEESAALAFVSHIRRLFPFDRFTLCVRQGEIGMIRHVFGQVDDLDKGVQFPLDEGLNGWVLKRNTPLIISNMKEGDYIRPRYFVEENTRHGFHSFLGIPFGSVEGAAWGSISLESKSAGQYGEKGRDVLTMLSVPLQICLERIYLKNRIMGDEIQGS